MYYNKINTPLRLLQDQKAKSKLQQSQDLIDEAENSPVVDGWTKEKFLVQIKRNSS